MTKENVNDFIFARSGSFTLISAAYFQEMLCVLAFFVLYSGRFALKCIAIEYSQANQVDNMKV